MAGFTLRQLELFAALPDHPTLAAAAAALHISESGLSHAITELESVVGEPLCIRRKARGVQLTPAGKYFVERARSLLREADGLIGELASSEGKLKGPVALGCYSGLASTVLPSVLEGFPRKHPGVELSLSLGTNDDLLPALGSGQLDAAIVYGMDLPPGMATHTIYRTEVMAVLPESHPLAHLESVDLKKLAPEPLILLDTTPSAANTRLMFSQRGLSPNELLSVPQLDLVRALVARGLGYSLLMSRPNTFPFSNEGRRIVARPLDPPAGVAEVVAVWPALPGISARTRALVEYASQVFDDSEPG